MGFEKRRRGLTAEVLPDVPSSPSRAEVLRYLPFMTVSEACDRNAETDGQREAVVDSSASYTWAQVKAITDGMAMGLLRHGIQRDDRIMVQLGSSARLFLVRIACEKAGVKAVLVPAAFRTAELRALVAHTQPKAAIIQSFLRKTDYLELWEKVAQESDCIRYVFAYDAPERNDWLRPMADLLAADTAGAGALFARTRFNLFERTFIACTSGTTGVPKCIDQVAYSRPLTGYMQAQRWCVGQGETLLALTPFISGVAESLIFAYGPYIKCKMVCLEHFTVEAMCEAISRHRPSVATIVPTMLSRLLEHDPDPAVLRPLRIFATYGASLPPDVARQVEDTFGCRVVQAYGCTEFGGISATCVEEPQEARIGTVGHPLDGNEVRVVTSDGSPAAPGEVGRVLVRGLHEAGEYYRNVDMVQDSWQSGWYAVGDLGYLDAAGRLVLTGRDKDVIIRGGQNIYPSELEAWVARHPAVAETAVVGYHDRDLGERVCACVVLKAGHELQLLELTDFLRGLGIATFKLPERLVVLSELPKNSTGLKVDKRALARQVAVGR